MPACLAPVQEVWKFHKPVPRLPRDCLQPARLFERKDRPDRHSRQHPPPVRGRPAAGMTSRRIPAQALGEAARFARLHSGRSTSHQHQLGVAALGEPPGPGSSRRHPHVGSQVSAAAGATDQRLRSSVWIARFTRANRRESGSSLRNLRSRTDYNGCCPRSSICGTRIRN